MNSLESLKIHLYADGADKAGMIKLYQNSLIKGLTTNPTLMRKAGITDYESFCRDLLETVKSKPVSFEVFSDEFSEMRRQGLKIKSWGENVYVKIPITNSRGESALPLIAELAQEGVKLNVTALLTIEQVQGVADALQAQVPSVVSVFAGRIADTGVDPMAIMKQSAAILEALPAAELLWASVREVINIWHAEEAGAKIITVPHDILNKAMSMVGKDLTELSLDTVKMFAQDALQAGFTL